MTNERMLLSMSYASFAGWPAQKGKRTSVQFTIEVHLTNASLISVRVDAGIEHKAMIVARINRVQKADMVNFVRQDFGYRAGVLYHKWLCGSCENLKEIIKTSFFEDTPLDKITSSIISVLLHLAPLFIGWPSEADVLVAADNQMF